MGKLTRRRRHSFLLLAILPVMLTGGHASAQTETAEPNVEFDASFLHLRDQGSIDLTHFAAGSSALPGTYDVAVQLNQQLIMRSEVTFITQVDGRVAPCLTPALLLQLPLDNAMLPEHKADNTCIDLAGLIHEAHVNYDSNAQILDIIVPQQAVSHVAQGYVPAELWDSGIPALLLSYATNGYNSEANGSEYRSLYTNLNGGVNLGSWYVRHNGAWSASDVNGNQYQSINTYAQHDLPPLKGRLLLGQSNTSGDLFDTLPFTGVQLESDERMEPLSRRGYAPEIRGIAHTNAKVTVSQNGTQIYETTVTPGAFAISDLYPTGYGGDLDVTIREADGSEQHFQVPWSALTQQLRPGVSRYALTVGQLHNHDLHSNPDLLQAAWRYGLNNLFTVYSGIQASRGYTAGQVGTAVGSPMGSISLDVTHARTETDTPANGTRRFSGESYRLSYNKTLTTTGSNITLAAYRFSTREYMDFITAMQTREAINQGEEVDAIRHAKDRFTLTASQALGESGGQFYLSTSVEDFWNSSERNKQYQFGYSNIWKRLTYDISANRTYSTTGKGQDAVMLNVSLPLGNTSGAPQGHMSYSDNSNGQNSLLASVSGTAGQENQLSYNVSGGTTNQGVGSSGSVSGQYINRINTLSGGYSTGKHYSTLSAGMSGSVIGHAGGLTFTPYQGDTFALVDAPGLEGATINNYTGVSVNESGYAAIPYLMPYQFNDISIDPKGTDSRIELESTLHRIVPRDAAIVKVTWRTRKGTPMLITVENDPPLSFGAEVTNSQGHLVGYVGQGGRLFVRVEQDDDTLSVQLKGEQPQRCNLSYHLSSQDRQRKTVSQVSSVCRWTS